MHRLETDGKFFRSGKDRVFVRAVTYGPFPGGWPDDFSADFSRMRAAGFNALRLYSWPPHALLTAAQAHGLHVFAGLNWGDPLDFISQPQLLAAARVTLAENLAVHPGHPALAGVFVANEVPADMARWMGPLRVRDAIDELILLGRSIAPHLLFAYGNYPTTEYLEPQHADFTAFNLYLEDEEKYRAYLRRLHHIAGDRPLLISEFGIDTRSRGLAAQSEMMSWALRAAADEETAGFTAYAWSDRWFNAREEVLDWEFGLIDRDGKAKPALSSLSTINHQPSTSSSAPRWSVIVCTRNGRHRLTHCLRSIAQLRGVEYETIVVDDGSSDGTTAFIVEKFPWAKVITLKPSGLSAARNAGAAAASGDWLAYTDDDCAVDPEWLLHLSHAITRDDDWAAVGGPNLPPPAVTSDEAIVASAPGAPSHVMLDDTEAEHLPGCNFAIRKEVLLEIGGFDPQFHAAGDDVDLCWRLRDAGHRLGFAPGAFVWHWRRGSLRGYLKQQIGYGHAEALLKRKHPHRFGKAGAKWQGFVYTGGPLTLHAGSVIYHGAMGTAGYQGIAGRMMPLRPLDSRFNGWRENLKLRWASWLQPRVRAWARGQWLLCLGRDPTRSNSESPAPTRELALWSETMRERDDLLRTFLADGWQPSGENDAWDLIKNDTRVLIAVERGHGRACRVLVRVWGAAALPRLVDG